MGRTALIASMSMVVGAGLTYLLLPTPEISYVMPTLDTSDTAGTPVTLQQRSARSGTALLASLLDGRFGVGERAAVYAIVAGAEIETLKQMARELWAADSSTSREFALDVIFSRMIEIDGSSAIDLIRQANPAAEQMLAAALTIIASRGVTAANMNSIVAALPLDERRFKTEALKHLVVTDPERAIALAVGEPQSALRIELLREVAVAWSARDLKAARAAIANIADRADRAAFEAGLTTRLAQSDPEQVLLDAARASTPAGGDQLNISLAAQGVAAKDPRRALELADGLKGEQRDIALRAAIQAWGSEDPYGALAFVERLGPGRDRDTLLRAIGQEIGRQDPNGALAWFRSLDSSPQGLYGSILQGVAQREPQRALELALESGDPSAVLLTSMAVRSGEVSFADLGARVLAMESGGPRDERVQTLMNTWARKDPEEAMSWLVSHGGDLSRDALSRAAETLARQNPGAAIGATQSLPAEHREAWVRAVALGYAQTDPAGAKSWMEQYRGQAVFDAGMTAIVQVSATRNPADAAAMLPSFTDATTRERAATTVAQRWTERDSRAAHDWATSLPPGSLRDAALTGTMMTSDELPDAGTLARFQSDHARQEAILNVAARRAQENLDDARAMVDRHVGDPGLRSKAEQVFESIRASRDL
jgi:hypothetical protein